MAQDLTKATKDIEDPFLRRSVKTALHLRRYTPFYVFGAIWIITLAAFPSISQRSTSDNNFAGTRDLEWTGGRRRLLGRRHGHRRRDRRRRRAGLGPDRHRGHRHRPGIDGHQGHDEGRRPGPGALPPGAPGRAPRP